MKTASAKGTTPGGTCVHPSERGDSLNGTARTRRPTLRYGSRSMKQSALRQYQADGDSEQDEQFPECPTCGRTDFESELGVKYHHAMVHDEPLRVTVACAWCDTPKEIIPARAKDYDRHFCDNNCRGAWLSEQSGESHPLRKEKVEVTCAWCGESKKVYPSRIKAHDRHFCDHDCHSAWRSKNIRGEDHPLRKEWTEVTCAWCGESREVRANYAENHDRHFCDHDCYGSWISENLSGEDNPNWEGGTFPYGSGWNDTTKERIRDRQDRKCLGCGLTETQNGRKLSVHHIKKARSLLDADPEIRNGDGNLVALCRNCHPKWERMSPLRPQISEESENEERIERLESVIEDIDIGTGGDGR